MFMIKSGGFWKVYFDDNSVRQYLTQAQGVQLMAKVDTAKAIVAAVKALAPTADTAADLESEYFDVGEFGDADVASLGITAADLASCITLLQQVNLLMTGGANAPAIYRSTLNKVRRVTT